MPKGNCVVPCCKNRTGGHLFPRNEISRKNWTAAVGKGPYWVPNKYNIVCYDHFLESDYLKESLHFGFELARKMLKKGTIPSVNLPLKVPDVFVSNVFTNEGTKPETGMGTAIKCYERTPKIVPQKNPVENEKTMENIFLVKEEINCVGSKDSSEDVYVSEDMIQVVLKEEIEDEEVTQKLNITTELEQRTPKIVSQSNLMGNEKTMSEDMLQIVIKEEIDEEGVPQQPNVTKELKRHTGKTIIKQPVKKVTLDIATQTLPVPNLGIEKFENDDKAIKYFTGINTYKKFMFIFRTLGREVHKLKYHCHTVKNLSVENQFFLTLIKIRKRKPNFELSLMFGLSEQSISNILLTWIAFMANQWKELGTWPDKEVIDHFFPSDKPLLRERVTIVRLKNENNLKNSQIPKDKTQNAVNKLTGEILRLKQYYYILNGPFSTMENKLAGEIVFICCMLQNFKKGISKTAKK